MRRELVHTEKEGKRSKKERAIHYPAHKFKNMEIKFARKGSAEATRTTTPQEQLQQTAAWRYSCFIEEINYERRLLMIAIAKFSANLLASSSGVPQPTVTVKWCVKFSDRENNLSLSFLCSASRRGIAGRNHHLRSLTLTNNSGH